MITSLRKEKGLRARFASLDSVSQGMRMCSGRARSEIALKDRSRARPPVPPTPPYRILSPYRISTRRFGCELSLLLNQSRLNAACLLAKRPRFSLPRILWRPTGLSRLVTAIYTHSTLWSVITGHALDTRSSPEGLKGSQGGTTRRP
jgi:hypothetical protein